MKEEYPRLQEVRKTMPEVAAAILAYKDSRAMNPFSLIPVVGQSGGGVGGLIFDVSLKNTASLNQRQYHVLYTWGKTDEEYRRNKCMNEDEMKNSNFTERDKVATITQERQFPGIIIINWESWEWGHNPHKELRRGFGELESLLRSL